MVTPLRKTSLALLALTAATFAACSKSTDHPNPVPATVVLVHGSWQGAFAWAPVKSQLEQKGYTVVTVELPAHGADRTPVAGLTLASCMVPEDNGVALGSAFKARLWAKYHMAAPAQRRQRGCLSSKVQKAYKS